MISNHRSLAVIKKKRFNEFVVFLNVQKLNTVLPFLDIM